MLAAMEKNPFVVMGSEKRDIDYERVWNNELDKRLRRKQLQNTGARTWGQGAGSAAVAAAAGEVCQRQRHCC